MLSCLVPDAAQPSIKQALIVDALPHAHDPRYHGWLRQGQHAFKSLMIVGIMEARRRAFDTYSKEMTRAVEQSNDSWDRFHGRSGRFCHCYCT
ncbi:SWR1 complex bromodomain subunit bdf1 [Fusarium oxysporum f. sp. albedinis]|nr:SWR1 complex bromodomain subunit bdf1 [Fusarium oxysporum f. sp. albedinis]